MRIDDKMDGSQGVGAVGTNSSSDFVSSRLLPAKLRTEKEERLILVMQVRKLYKYVPSVSHTFLRDWRKGHADGHGRMLEDPTYSQVVRWGDEGDSFVVLEVGLVTTKMDRRKYLTSVLE